MPAIAGAGDMRFSGCLSHSCQLLSISWTPLCKVFKFGTNIHTDSRLTWLHFDGQRSEVKAHELNICLQQHQTNAGTGVKQHCRRLLSLMQYWQIGPPNLIILQKSAFSFYTGPYWENQKSYPIKHDSMFSFLRTTRGKMDTAGKRRSYCCWLRPFVRLFTEDKMQDEY